MSERDRHGSYTRMTHWIERVLRNGIAFEEVWCIYLETVTSKVVGKKLSETQSQ
jgi:hypothetical protein